NPRQPGFDRPADVHSASDPQAVDPALLGGLGPRVRGLRPPVAPRRADRGGAAPGLLRELPPFSPPDPVPAMPRVPPSAGPRVGNRSTSRVFALSPGVRERIKRALRSEEP